MHLSAIMTIAGAAAPVAVHGGAPIATCISASAGKTGQTSPGIAREPHRRREIWLCAGCRVERFVVLTRNGAENFLTRTGLHSITAPAWLPHRDELWGQIWGYRPAIRHDG